MPRFDVTLAGELNLDLILYGLPDELPPETELLASDMMLTLGGSSAIVAHNLATLGCKVGFISKIGTDNFGTIALTRLLESGVDVSKVRSDTALKTGLTVILQRAKWRNMVTYAGTITEVGFEDLDLDYLCNSKHFHLSSYFLQRRLQPRMIELFQKLKAAGLTISLDTNDDPDATWDSGVMEILRYVDVFLPNEREVRKIGRSDDLNVAVARMAKVVPLVVVKMGAEGAMAIRGTERLLSPAQKIQVVDAVGAGDSFNSGFLSRFVNGATLAECLSAGNQAGARSTSCSGGTEAFRVTR